MGLIRLITTMMSKNLLNCGVRKITMCNVKAKLEKSITDFICKNEILLIEDVNERTLSCKIVAELSKQFRSWDVDAEYNRFGDGIRTKYIPLAKIKFLKHKAEGDTPNSQMTIDELIDNPEKAPVFPDIIVHKRTELFSNLLIVEVKKENNPELFNGWDEWKIKYFMDTFQYQYGAHVVLKSSKKLDSPQNYISKIQFFL